MSTDEQQVQPDETLVPATSDEITEDARENASEVASEVAGEDVMPEGADPVVEAESGAGGDGEDEPADQDGSDADVDADAGAGEDGEDEPADAEQTRGRSRRGGAARLEREGEIAADFLERLLDIADLDGDLDVDVEGERASVAIVDSPEGRVPRRLVGQNGEVLDALQELTRLAVQARTGDRSRLMLDVAGHRARRREQLVERAQVAIGEVRDSGEPLRLEAMNPFERKIVHDAVAAAGLSSSSEGVEPDRRIVIRPAD